MTATLTAGSPDLTLPPTPLEVALAAVLERRTEFRALGHVPRDVVDLFTAAGVYRAATPRRFGGEALPVDRPSERRCPHEHELLVHETAITDAAHRRPHR